MRFEACERIVHQKTTGMSGTVLEFRVVFLETHTYIHPRTHTHTQTHTTEWTLEESLFSSEAKFCHVVSLMISTKETLSLISSGCRVDRC